MKIRDIKKTVNRVPALLLLALMIPTLAYATGPRVTGALFSVDKPEIYAVDTAPFISMEVAGGGVTTEIVNTVLAAGKIDAVVTTLPLQRMVKYYLNQENALAVMGRHFIFSKEEKKDLIFVPITVSAEKYYYYKPFNPNGLSWNGDLKNLKGKRYGAHHGEDISAYKKAGIDIVYGRTVALMKKLKSGEVDFIGVPEPSVKWLLKHYLSDEKGNIVAMDGNAHDEPIFIIFNGKHPNGKAAADKFSKVLSKMIGDGSYFGILKRHMDDPHAEAYLKRLQNYQ